ncbi:Sodium/hydrogen exchanger family-domain-containing protein [Pavlovales sp. CCMP2436]|nr:Sodium/hydrogen exchanger family-domain-containing protein [Pavlovales sp. CCMP2436]
MEVEANEQYEQTFPVLLWVVAYCACLWAAGQLCRAVRVSAAIGEIVIAGMFGVTLMVMESGLHVNFEAMRNVGVQAAGVAVFGALIPLASGLLFLYAVDRTRFPPWPIGLAVGVALAPTSVGLALKMLKEASRVQAREGQLIMAAAFLDDVISLVLLATLLEIGGAVSVARPFVFATIFCVVATLVCAMLLSAGCATGSTLGSVEATAKDPVNS